MTTIDSEIEWLAKVMYLKHNMDAIKADPNHWATLPHAKQVELHKIKKELDEHFANMPKEHAE